MFVQLAASKCILKDKYFLYQRVKINMVPELLVPIAFAKFTFFLKLSPFFLLYSS